MYFSDNVSYVILGDNLILSIIKVPNVSYVILGDNLILSIKLPNINLKVTILTT